MTSTEVLEQIDKLGLAAHQKFAATILLAVWVMESEAGVALKEMSFDEVVNLSLTAFGTHATLEARLGSNTP